MNEADFSKKNLSYDKYYYKMAVSTTETDLTIMETPHIDTTSYTKRREERQIRTGEEADEQHVIPQNRIFIVFVGLMLTVFLAALDQTIVGIFTS